MSKYDYAAKHLSISYVRNSPNYVYVKREYKYTWQKLNAICGVQIKLCITILRDIDTYVNIGFW